MPKSAPMRAIVAQTTGGPEVMSLIEKPTAEPKKGELRVRVEAAGVNYLDVYHRTGLYKQPLPVPLGMEGAGIVEALGEGVTAFAIGDRVAWASVAGSYATEVIAPAEKVVRVPAGVDARTAAAAMLQGMTAQYLCTSTYPLARGERCLVHAAAGGVGLLLCQLAKRRGAIVYGTTSTRDKAERAKRAGADEVILYTETDFVQEILRLTNGEKVSVVYDSVGKTTFEKSLDCLRLRGMMVSFGQSSGPIPPIDVLALSAKGSLYLTRCTLFNYTATRRELEERSADVFNAILEGALKIEIHAAVPLDKAADAHRMLESRGTSGKLILTT